MTPPLDQQFDDDKLLNEPEENTEMPFIEHLEIFRWHIIRSLIGVGIIMLIAIVGLVISPDPYSDDTVFDYLIFGPVRPGFITYTGLCSISNSLGLDGMLCVQGQTYDFLNTQSAGQFLLHLRMAFIIGLCFSFPYFFWEMWRFIKPGLKRKEVNYTQGIVFFTSILFTLGAMFGYFLLAPLGFTFLFNYTVSPTIQNMFSVENYTSYLTMFVLASGLIFELPMVVYFLSKLGIVTPDGMRKYRKHSVVAILLISAFITPADVGTQLLVFIPVYVLYELSIFISARVVRNMEKEFS